MSRNPLTRKVEAFHWQVSLIDAGVLPKIEEIGIGDQRGYVCVRMVPSHGSHPFDALLRAFHDHAPFTFSDQRIPVVRAPSDVYIDSS